MTHTPSSAAPLLGVGVQQVRAYIRSGRLRAERLGLRAYAITEEALEEFRAQPRRARGNPQFGPGYHARRKRAAAKKEKKNER